MGHRSQPTVAYQPVEQLGVMDDLELTPSCGYSFFNAFRQCAQVAMILVALASVQGVGVLHGELLIDELISGASRRVAGTRLAVAEYGVTHAGEMQQFGDGSRGLLGPVFVRPGAADPEEVLHRGQVLDVLADHRHAKGQILGPVHASARAHVPWISLVLQAFEQAVELARKLRLDIITSKRRMSRM